MGDLASASASVTDTVKLHRDVYSPDGRVIVLFQLPTIW